MERQPSTTTVMLRSSRFKHDFEKIYGKSPYKSPTDMGVNMAGNCICDDAVCCEASRQEIVRRYYDSLNSLLKGNSPEEEAQKIELLMNQANVTIQDRHVVAAALNARKRHIHLLLLWNWMTDVSSPERPRIFSVPPLPFF